MRQFSLPLSCASTALGVLLVLLAELAHLEWAKIFGAVAISFGAIGLGIRWGLSGRRAPGWVARVGRDVAVLTAVVLAAPTIAALLVGLWSAANGLAHMDGWRLIGLVLNLLFAIVVLLALRVTLTALQRVSAGAEGSPGQETR